MLRVWTDDGLKWQWEDRTALVSFLHEQRAGGETAAFKVRVIDDISS